MNMKYKIIQKEIQGDIVNTVVEFDYKGQTRTVSVMHFRPKNVNDIENGIVNRINSEMGTLDSIELNNTIQVELNVEKDLTVFIPNSVTNPFSDFTIEELNQKLSLLSADYNTISQKISEAQAELASNSAEYDLIIEELKNRIV